MTHTFAVLEISKAAYDEIAEKLKDAGYQHAFVTEPDGVRLIDMRGIALGIDTTASDNDTKSFEEVWASTGYRYGPDALENVRLGWRLARDTLSVSGILRSAGFEQTEGPTFSYDPTDPPASAPAIEGPQPPEAQYTALDYLRLIAEGWEVIESTGSQMTIQNPEDDGPQDLVIDVDAMTGVESYEHVDQAEMQGGEAALAIGEHAFKAGFDAGASALIDETCLEGVLLRTSLARASLSHRWSERSGKRVCRQPRTSMSMSLGRARTNSGWKT